MRRKKSGLENLVLITQLGINVMTSVFLCVAAGVWLDKKFGTSLVLPLLLLGILAGGLSAYRMARRTIDREKEEIEKERKAQVENWERQYGTGDGTGDGIGTGDRTGAGTEGGTGGNIRKGR